MGISAYLPPPKAPNRRPAAGDCQPNSRSTVRRSRAWTPRHDGIACPRRDRRGHPTGGVVGIGGHPPPRVCDVLIILLAGHGRLSPARIHSVGGLGERFGTA